MKQIKNILYLGWLGKGNVGDDILFELFKHMFYKYHQSKDNYIVNIDAHPNVNNYKIEVAYYDLIVLSGGSILHLPFYLNICAEAIGKQIPVVTWGTGIDWFFRPEDLKTINLSVNNQNDYKKIYENFEYISVRGPYTKNFLRNMGLSKNVHEVGDPAIAYADELFGEKIKLINQLNKAILVNWGTSYNNIFGKDEIKVEQELASVIKVLISRGYTVTVYPIWIEDIKPVKRLVELVNDERCQAITQVYEAKILQKLIAQSYMTINLKLHANILSASANRPFISLAYRGKCFDFAESINCSKYAVATDEVTSKVILNLVEDIEKNYANIVRKISQAKNKYYPELKKSIHIISEILNKRPSIEARAPFPILNGTEDKKISTVKELIGKVIVGLEHILMKISEGDFNQTISLFLDLCKAFSVIENSLKNTSVVLSNSNILYRIESIKNNIQKTVIAYEKADEIQLKNELLKNLITEFKSLNEHL